MIANRRFFIEITDFTGPLFRDPVGPSLSPVSVGRVWTRVQVHEAAGTSSCVIGRGTPSGEERGRARTADLRHENPCVIHAKTKQVVRLWYSSPRWRVERPAPRVPAPVVSLPHGGKKSYKITIFSRFSFDPRER